MWFGLDRLDPDLERFLGGLESPLRAINRYEKQRGFVQNAIGRVIVAQGENGAFAKLERGELPLAQFYPLVSLKSFLLFVTASGFWT